MRICSCGAVIPGSCCPHCGACHRRAPGKVTAAVLALGLTVACGDGFAPQPAYGVPDTGDFDNDGYLEPDDCDDTNAEIYPGAEETAGDGVDSNCDGEDDPQS